MSLKQLRTTFLCCLNFSSACLALMNDLNHLNETALANLLLSMW